MPRYTGRGPRDAAALLDFSQGKIGHNNRYPAHPRGHVSNQMARGPQDSVERYSMSGRKTGFFTKEDQDTVVHDFLESTRGRRALEDLNRGSDRESLRESIRQHNLIHWRLGQGRAAGGVYA
uniref:Putative membrane protein ycf78 n=1 Tax=Lygus hesperus TaxID=30085 RepID=A0A0A9YI54_LYGHE